MALLLPSLLQPRPLSLPRSSFHSFEMTSVAPPSGVFTNSALQKVYWGPGCTEKALNEAVDLLSKTKKVFILTGNSLANKTDVIKNIEKILGSSHAATFSGIGQHAPEQDSLKAVQLMHEKKADVIVAVGGGSPIDAAKLISMFSHDEDASLKGNDDIRTFIPVIAIPTTLSAAETTQNAGYTKDGKKVSTSHPALAPRVIICDAKLTLATPHRLWISSGMRAVDHAIEMLYRPDPSPILRPAELGSLRELFHLLPATNKNPDDLNIRQTLQVIALASLWPESRKGAIGLSHGLGHALGATYSIPHGITSCITLAKSIELTATLPSTPIEQLLALSNALDLIPAPYNPSPSPLGLPSSILASQSGDELKQTVEKARKRGVEVGKAVQRLVDNLGLHTTLKSSNVPENDLDTIAHHVAQGNEDMHSAVLGMLRGMYSDDGKL